VTAGSSDSNKPKSLDAPERSQSSDVLGRWTFAQGIYDLITTTEEGITLRIAVYGGWGEGKTTVLNFIEEFAHKDHLPTAWFNPWASQDRNELWTNFLSSIKGAFEKPLPLTGAERVSSALKLKKYITSAAAINPIAKAIAEIGGKVLEQFAVKKAHLEKLLNEQLGEKRLIIFIDDLDRAQPDLVIHLLLGLREIFDLPKTAFVLALDPKVIAEALPEVHSGWGKTPAFLDKIIDYSFWLPSVEQEDVKRLANSQLRTVPISIPKEISMEAADLLPTNPRKLKLFFRKLYRLKTVLARHENSDVEWLLLLLLELLHSLSPSVSTHLLKDDKFWPKLFYSNFGPKMAGTRTGDGGMEEEEWVQMARRALTEHKEQEISEKQLLEILMAIRNRTSLLAQSNFSYWASLTQTPPAVTWKEFHSFFALWQGDKSAKVIETFVSDHAVKLNMSQSHVARELFHTCLLYRNSLLSEAADSTLAEALAEFVSKANEALDCLCCMVLDLKWFSPQIGYLQLSEYEALFGQFNHWLHFNNDEYQTTRGAEQDFLKLTCMECSYMAPQILEKFAIWINFDASGRSALANIVIESLSAFIYEDLAQRFARKDGISSLWGKDRHLVEKFFLFGADKSFFTPSRVEYLRSLSDIAPSNADVRLNFYEFIRLLTYGLTNILDPLSPAEIHPLAKDTIIIGIAWRAATCRRLQPRVHSSMLDAQKVLVQIAGADTHLPIPDWLKTSSTPPTESPV
jgi:hypothetical protein